jgi:hypothetical protein
MHLPPFQIGPYWVRYPESGRHAKDPAWAKRVTAEDRRALSALFWSHVNPYGRFLLDMDKRLDLDATAA